MQLRTGLYKNALTDSHLGWQILFEQEKHPFVLTDKAKGCCVMVCEGDVPEDLEEFMEDGGIAVLSGISPDKLGFICDYRFKSVIEKVSLPDQQADCRICCAVDVYDGEGIGKIRVHEKRKIKGNMHPDEYPAALFQKVGKGGCWYTGIPLSMLITAMGDILRNVDDFSNYTERITSIDKHKLLKFMKYLVKDAYVSRGLPYVRLAYYPKGYRNWFTFRIDLDGIYGDHLKRLYAAAELSSIPLSLYANKLLCEPDVGEIKNISHMHEKGSHARTHNLYSEEDDNYKNLKEAEDWMKEENIPAKKGFVAPRGLWNPNLQRALEKLGYEFTSDFGYCIYGLPFYPYIGEQRSKVLQIPVSPFSSERANVQAKEEWGRDGITPEEVAQYFLELLARQYEEGEPSVLYSHPEVFGGFSEKVFPHIRKFLDSKGDIWVTTMDKISDWWRLRDGASYEASYEKDKGLIIAGELPSGLQVVEEH